MDMIGRTKGPGFTDPDATHVLVNPGEILVVGPNISSDDLEKTIETVNGSYQKLKLNHFYDVTAPDATHDNLGPQPRGQRIFYRSDHYNFAKMGIPIAFFTTGLHPDYHRPTDTPEKIDYKRDADGLEDRGRGRLGAGQPAGPSEAECEAAGQLMKDMKTRKIRAGERSRRCSPRFRACRISQLLSGHQRGAAAPQVRSVGGDVGEKGAWIVRGQEDFGIAADAHRDAFAEHRSEGAFSHEGDRGVGNGPAREPGAHAQRLRRRDIFLGQRDQQQNQQHRAADPSIAARREDSNDVEDSGEQPHFDL